MYGYNIYGEKINHLLYMDDLVQKETYKYLGMEESDGIQHGKMRENKTRMLQTSKRSSVIGA